MNGTRSDRRRWRRRMCSAGAGVALALLAAPAFAQPDLVVDGPAMASSWVVVDVPFSSSSCEVGEGCVGAPGIRRLLRFDMLTGNISQTDLTLGSPVGNPLFEFDTCEREYHFKGFSRYTLLDGAGQPAAPGHKSAICMTDSEQYLADPWVPTTSQFNCDNQGIQRGWADHYAASCACQWIDVTNVPAGDYVLQVEVNPDRVLVETDYSNNTASAPVTLPPTVGIPPRPDGRRVPGSPLRVSPATGGVAVDYDVATCPAPSYNLDYGTLNGAWSYAYAGAVCGLGPTGHAIVALPDPPVGQGTWFLVVGADPAASPAREGGHGFDSNGAERPLSGVGFCSVAVTQSGPTCGGSSLRAP